MDRQLDASRLLLRKATLTDLPAVIRLLHEDTLGSTREVVALPVRQSYSDAFSAIDRDPNSELIVAELDGKIVGTLQLNVLTYLSFQGSKAAQIEAVRIAKDLRGHGRFGARHVRERLRRLSCSAEVCVIHK